MLTEILIVLALIALNGALSMSELAIVSARPARLRPLEGRSRGAAQALRLAEHPGKFLSTVQIGITLVGILSGAFSGATLGPRLATLLARLGVEPDLAHSLGVGGVVVVLTYLSLIIGELVPKQLALRNPEAVAIRVAPAMAVLSVVSSPIVWFLDWSGRLILWLMGAGRDGKARVTQEEVRSLLTEAHEDGALENEERDMITGVMRLADRSARALMTPRPEIDMIDLAATPAEALAAIRRIARPRMPVLNRDTDEVVGIITLTDAFAAMSRRQPLNIAALLREVPVVSDMADALDVMQILRKTSDHLVLVYDEYGVFEGIITSGDILEAITGTLGTAFSSEPSMVEREDGSYLVAGWMPADEFCERLNLPRSLAGEYETVAGLMLHQLRHLPGLGDHVTAEGWRFEVIDLDDRRIDKLLVSRA
jgi:putative hemolysin